MKVCSKPNCEEPTTGPKTPYCSTHNVEHVYESREANKDKPCAVADCDEPRDGTYSRCVEHNKEMRSAWGRTWRGKNGSNPYDGEYQRARKYGMTREGFRDFMEPSVCRICGKVTEKLHIDHDHNCCTGSNTRPTCGRCTREPLCRNCNLGLGGFKDDPDLLREAADYVERHSLRIGLQHPILGGNSKPANDRV